MGCAEKTRRQQQTRPGIQALDQRRLQHAAKQQLFCQHRHAEIDGQPQQQPLWPFGLPGDQPQGDGQYRHQHQCNEARQPCLSQRNDRLPRLPEPPGEQGGAQQQLLQLLDQAAAAIGEEGAQVQVQQLDFSAERGDLALNLQASDFSALESLRTRLQEAGLAVDMGSASREDNGVSARLVIGGNG